MSKQSFLFIILRGFYPMSATALMKQELFALLKSESFKRGRFQLASGAMSDYYLDCRLTTLNGRGAYLLGHLLSTALDGLHLDAVGGMTLGADPMIASVLYHSAACGHPLQGFIVRKHAKDHGAGRQVEGPLRPWMRVALLEDVVTSGGSTLKAIEAIEREYPGIQIKKVIAIVDRNGGGREAFTRRKIPFEALYPVEEFLAADA
jgi:orotate phosphoribosyltransferase